jgi:hypothetical protein
MKNIRNFRVGKTISDFEITDMKTSIMDKTTKSISSITIEQAEKKIKKCESMGGLWKVCLCASGKPHFYKTEEEAFQWAINFKKSDDKTINFI